jgi:RNAse (barnase) inhibitor barstar
MTRQKTETWRGQVRMPLPIAEWVRAKADKNYRTMNSQVVEMLRRIKEDESCQKNTEGACL